MRNITLLSRPDRVEHAIACSETETSDGAFSSVNVHSTFELAYRLNSAIWVFDVDNSSIIHANAAACLLWAAENEDSLTKRDLSADMSPSVARRMKQYQEDFRTLDCAHQEPWTLYPGGKPHHTIISYSGYKLPDNRLALLCEVRGILTGSHESIRMNEAILHTDVMICLYSEAGDILYMNPAARRYSNEAGRGLAESFVHYSDYKRIQDKVRKIGEYRSVCLVRTSCGVRWHDITVRNCLDAVSGQDAVLATAIDVTDLKNARDRAAYLADRDILTGSFNRGYIRKHIEDLSDDGPESAYAMLYFDVDRFKQINDQYGHEKGDEVLRQLVKRASSIVRSDDIVIRFGGDEFGILLKVRSSTQLLLSDFDRIRDALSKPVSIQSTMIDVTVSIGVSSFKSSSADYSKIMNEADIALYSSKQAGRNCVSLFSEEMGLIARSRDVLEWDLKRALEERSFVLHYQPRVDIKTGRVASVEALVRWNHSSRGLLLPGEFIPICEETGMIEELGRLVIEMACEQSIKWRHAGIELSISLNVSPRQFNGFALTSILKKFSADPRFLAGMIEIEITESCFMGNHSEVLAKLHEIKMMGYKIAVDDFGTGYSNLFNISQFPLDCLKIDRSFIGQLPKSGAILELILALGRKIGAVVVAEGVENVDQLEWLTERNFDQVQGFLFSRPCAVDDVMPLIESMHSTVSCAVLTGRGLCAELV